MCGIAGIFNYSAPNKPVSENILKKMLSVIRHRGPDESGIYLGNNIGIGNVRLSIIDLSTGQQLIARGNDEYIGLEKDQIVIHDFTVSLYKILTLKGVIL